MEFHKYRFALILALLKNKRGLSFSPLFYM